MVLPVQIVMGKTGEALVNRVSNAIGVVFEPHRMRRKARAKIDVAEAETKAEIIRAEGRLKISEIEARGLQRMIYEEGRNQENIESITSKAIPHLSKDAKPEDLEEDFVRYLFDKAKLVSNEEIQEIWARILAGEANTAGSFSRRSIDVVSQLSKTDAELFTRFVRSVWVIGRPTPIIIEYDDFEKKEEVSLSFNQLQHLESIGLITYSGTSTYSRTGFGKTARMFYYGCPVDLEFSSDGRNSISIGMALLTATGMELASISGAESSIPAFENGLKHLLSQNIAVSIPIEAKQAYLAL
ncbi:DUF2806 domain-containing protein [Rhizobium phaseoli]|uniref:DUF2806 domain-containing protein n=1 Tax=Rhizobium phaseoli TaxID=396 RepID=UPI0014385B83|nr:DUF2806 domain-containing protein [Rhizobium phaseoli]MDK4730147.1 DUF2806 domain-containing protein [Rhizobium phaseoli]NKE86978.1 DUF2806 domain-containing protein [Rhizobium phaseoli]